MHIWRDGPKVLVCLPIADIAGTKDLLYLARNKELLELDWEIVNSVWYVKIAYEENEDHRNSCG